MHSANKPPSQFETKPRFILEQPFHISRRQTKLNLSNVNLQGNAVFTWHDLFTTVTLQYKIANQTTFRQTYAFPETSHAQFFGHTLKLDHWKTDSTNREEVSSKTILGAETSARKQQTMLITVPCRQKCGIHQTMTSQNHSALPLHLCKLTTYWSKQFRFQL